MSNPVFNQNILNGERVLDAEPMTVNGAINKAFVLLGLLMVSSYVVWEQFAQGFMDKVNMLMMAGFVVSIVSFIVIMFNRKAMAISTSIYAIGEGLVLGGISAQFEKFYPGIVPQAVVASLGALATLLVLYRVGAIKCTDKFRSVLFVSTLSIAGIYLVSLIGGFFGMHIPQIFSSSNIGIGFSLAVVVIAALNLIIDFDFIERGAANMLSKEYEWYGAFGLMVTLVWLYLEILNLLAKMRDR